MPETYKKVSEIVSTFGASLGDVKKIDNDTVSIFHPTEGLWYTFSRISDEWVEQMSSMTIEFMGTE